MIRIFLLVVALAWGPWLPAAEVQSEAQALEPVFAADDELSDEEADASVEDGEAVASAAISRRQATELVNEHYQGRILSIRLYNGRWRVRLDSEGTVFNVFVDAQSGELSSE